MEVCCRPLFSAAHVRAPLGLQDFDMALKASSRLSYGLQLLVIRSVVASLKTRYLTDTGSDLSLLLLE